MHHGLVPSSASMLLLLLRWISLDNRCSACRVESLCLSFMRRYRD